MDWKYTHVPEARHLLHDSRMTANSRQANSRQEQLHVFRRRRKGRRIRRRVPNVNVDLAESKKQAIANDDSEPRQRGTCG